MNFLELTKTSAETRSNVLRAYNLSLKKRTEFEKNLRRPQKYERKESKPEGVGNKLDKKG